MSLLRFSGRGELWKQNKMKRNERKKSHLPNTYLGVLSGLSEKVKVTHRQLLPRPHLGACPINLIFPFLRPTPLKSTHFMDCGLITGSFACICDGDWRTAAVKFLSWTARKFRGKPTPTPNFFQPWGFAKEVKGRRNRCSLAERAVGNWGHPLWHRGKTCRETWGQPCSLLGFHGTDVNWVAMRNSAVNSVWSREELLFLSDRLHVHAQTHNTHITHTYHTHTYTPDTTHTIHTTTHIPYAYTYHTHNTHTHTQ